MTRPSRIGPMLRLVLAVGACLQPWAGPILRRRLRRGKEDPDRWREKLGQASIQRPEGPLVWLHGVGVGEVMALRGLIARLAEARPEVNFLLTSSARSSGEVIAANLPVRTVHQYLPLDLPGPVRSFLDHWHPDLAIWSDQEVWPRLAVSCARRGIPQAYVAARITNASAKARARFGAAYGNLYGLMDVIHAQDDRTAENLRSLMQTEAGVQVSGSLKAAAAPLVTDPDSLAKMQGLRRPVWVAASAHPADIDIALDAHQTLLRDHGVNSTLIIAPRRLEDAKPLRDRATDLGLTWRARGDGKLPDAVTDLFIADSFGELGIWYSAAHAALIGGTFDDTEGHNPWEAASLGCPVIAGPRRANFLNDFAILEEAEALISVNTAAELAEALMRPDLSDVAARARAVQTKTAQGMDRITTDLLALLGV